MLPRTPAMSLSANEDLGLKTWVLKTCLEDLGSEDLGSEDFGSTAFVQLKMARAAELVCKLYHNSPDRVLPTSQLQPRGYVDKILLERQSTDQALRVTTVRVACREPGKSGARSRQSSRTKTE